MAATIADPITLPCGVRLKNRLAKAAMTEGLADERNRATPRHEMFISPVVAWRRRAPPDVNFPRLQGPPAPRQPSGMLGYTPPLYSPSAGGAGGYGGYGGYGYGGGYGGGYSETPSAGYVQPGPRLTAGGSPYVAPRATPNAFEYAGPGRMVSGIQPQALLPRWYRNLTSWRFG